MIWDIQPEVFSFSPLPRWYSLLFALGIVSGYFIMRTIFRREGRPLEALDSLLMHIVLGMMIGMRLGHCFFYQPDYYFQHPLEILMIWRGGYASHGGFLGVIIALGLFVRRHRDMSFLWLADRVAIIGLNAAGWIRVGNFFNSEMIGHETTLPWGITFAQVDNVARHPAQLYEAIGYFVVAAIGWALYNKDQVIKRPGMLLGIHLILGFGWRFFCEFFKVDQVPFEQGMTFNLGQLLSLPFMAVGGYLVWRSKREAKG